jgi:hypothetical protein
MMVMATVETRHGRLLARAGSSRGARATRRWAFAAVPAVGLLELGAHAIQTHSIVPERDWAAARAYVSTQVRPDDLIAFAPTWIDPIGRKEFGAAMATVEREARPDESRFVRAFEVAIRGRHLRVLSGWRRAGEKAFGGVTVTTWENPTPARVVDDLVSMVDPRRMSVSYRGQDCPFVRDATQSGGLGFGPAIPSQRFSCPGSGFLGASVVADLDYAPHRCIYAPPSGVGLCGCAFSAFISAARSMGTMAFMSKRSAGGRGPP